MKHRCQSWCPGSHLFEVCAWNAVNWYSVRNHLHLYFHAVRPSLLRKAVFPLLLFAGVWAEISAVMPGVIYWQRREMENIMDLIEMSLLLLRETLWAEKRPFRCFHFPVVHFNRDLITCTTTAKRTSQKLNYIQWLGIARLLYLRNQ